MRFPHLLLSYPLLAMAAGAKMPAPLVGVLMLLSSITPQIVDIWSTRSTSSFILLAASHPLHAIAHDAANESSLRIVFSMI
jgi:hypothetical protein